MTVKVSADASIQSAPWRLRLRGRSSRCEIEPSAMPSFFPFFRAPRSGRNSRSGRVEKGRALAQEFEEARGRGRRRAATQRDDAEPARVAPREDLDRVQA